MSDRCLVTVSLATDRVRLRPHGPGDAPAAFAMLAGNEAILRWLVWSGPSTVEELAGFYRAWRREDPHSGREYRLAIEEPATGRLAGSIAIRMAPRGAIGDVGYWVGDEFQGRGLGREALGLMVRFAFGHLGATAIEARVFVGNGASRRILERSGFALVRTAPARLRPGRDPVDQWHFVLLLSEWRRLVAPLRLLEEVAEWRPAGDGEVPPGATPF